ncbi:MAG: hypothetical protein IPM97_10365 [Bdellovibrionaceae bacterium]|nr:hypothetical protein [Pseudobdellovibrionaceae bacterium]
MKKKQLPGTGLDDIIIPVSQKYYDRLHDKIMAKIEDSEMETPVQETGRRFKKMKNGMAEQVRLWLQMRNT